jgi:hypothetical protein
MDRSPLGRVLVERARSVNGQQYRYLVAVALAEWKLALYVG